jgi:hypothetical protein
MYLPSFSAPAKDLLVIVLSIKYHKLGLLGPSQNWGPKCEVQMKTIHVTKKPKKTR